MSLPPLNPEKTASGIVVDPRTLERVIPASRRKDGSVRKEQKVRTGFVPQEDMSAFRGRRQLEAEARRGQVPGSNNRQGLGSIRADNPFAQQQQQQQQPQSKAAVKNAKRTVKKAEFRPSTHRNWDSESDDEDEDEATRRAFAALRVDTKDEKAFPPLGDRSNGGSKRNVSGHSRSGSTSPAKAGSVSPIKSGSISPQKSAWKSLEQVNAAPEPAPVVPPAPRSAPLPQSSSSAAATSASDTPSTLLWRSGRGRGAPRGHAPSASWSPATASHWNSQRPHPIQGGRRGPIGLAFPPPIEPPAPSPRGRGRGRGGGGGRGGRGGGGGGEGGRGGHGGRGGRGGHAAHGSYGGFSDRGNNNYGNNSDSYSSAGGGAASAPERPPRERAPVRVREGGPLADRVRNLLLHNQAVDGPPRPRRTPGSSSTLSGASPSASAASAASATSGASGSA